MTIEIDLDAIERAALAATQEEWRLIERGRWKPAVQRGAEGGFLVEGLSAAQEDADAAYIIATQPAVVAELVRRLREAEKEVARLSEADYEHSHECIACRTNYTPSRGASQDCPRAELAEGWQPIDTAPKDGVRVLVFAVSEDDPYDRPSTIAEAWWGDEGGTELPHWMGLGLTCWHRPTHWMPLPADPKPGDAK